MIISVCVWKYNLEKSCDLVSGCEEHYYSEKEEEEEEEEEEETVN